jgi:hypothetical protein
VTIREDGTIDLGVCREALVEYLRKCAERDSPDTDDTSTPGLEYSRLPSGFFFYPVVNQAEIAIPCSQKA